MRLKGLYKLFKRKYPNIPYYVLRDMYGPISHDRAVLEAYMSCEFIADLNHRSWQLETVSVNLSDFDAETSYIVLKRNFGDVVFKDARDDSYRTRFQRSVARGDGLNEPVILVESTWDYLHRLSVVEGWHRVMSLLLLGYNGLDPRSWDKVKIRAWIGI